MIIFLIIIILLLSCICGYFLKNRIQVIKINEDSIKINEELQQEQKIANDKLKNLYQSIQQQTDVLNNLNKTAEDLKISAEKQANEFYQSKLKENEDKLSESYRAIALDYADKLSDLDMQIQKSNEKLKDLEAKQLAYIKSKQRQEEINQKQDYYRLVISDDDKNDIQLLRDLQKRLVKKETIDKIIYEVYYKSAYDILMSHLFKDRKEKVCGIYKITDLTTGLAYIGQSVKYRPMKNFSQQLLGVA